MQYPELYDGHNALAGTVYSFDNKHGATGDDDDPLTGPKGWLKLDRANLEISSFHSMPKHCDSSMLQYFIAV